LQWYKRLTESGDGERRESIRGPRMVDVINSTELRLVGFPMNAIGAFPALAVNNDPEARQKWKLPREVEAEVLTWYR
jgi:hypothetical protein